jgi:peptidoglycan/xylan/chitin deacetylase (PgdA/CDA1 family)
MTPFEKFETENQPKTPTKIFRTLRRIMSKESQPDPPIEECNYKMKQIPGQPGWFPQNLHITIDDGPNLKYLGNILSTLRQHKVKATFFFVGTSIRGYLNSKEKAPILKKLLAQLVEDGHHIGYHCYAHCHNKVAAKSQKECKGKSFGNMRQSQIEKDFNKYQETLAEALGYSYDLEIGRPPGGSGKNRRNLLKAYKNLGLQAPKLWHVEDMSKYKDSKLSKLGRIFRSTSRTKEFVKKIREKDSDLIMLFHEKPNRDKYLDILFKALKKTK